jgi:hypothetical protein
VESVLAREMVLRAVYLGPAVVIAFWILRGWVGAWSAAIGVVVVVLNFLLAGAMLSISARISLQAYHAAALIGFFLRLGLLVGAMYLIVAVVEVDRLAFGIAAVVSYLTLLVLEAIAISRNSERGLTWTR